MKAGSAAKLIVDALLQRFLPLARRRIETAQAQVLYNQNFRYFHVSIHFVGLFIFFVRCTASLLLNFLPRKIC